MAASISIVSSLVVSINCPLCLIMLPPFLHIFVDSGDSTIPTPPFAPLVGCVSDPWCIEVIPSVGVCTVSFSLCVSCIK